MTRKILTVDDSKTIRMIVAKAFKSFDCVILEAANGVEGLALAARERPDVIILDLTMPLMDGYETLTKLKSDPELKHIPVVMLTAEAGRENVLRIAKQGVRDYLVKPFKEDLVIERIGRVIELKRKEAAPAKPRSVDTPLKVLVVDDKPAIWEQIKTSLAEHPWSVEGRAQVNEAVAYCSQASPDVVVVSLALPEGGGFTFFQTLRANDKTKAIPVFGLCVKTAAEEQSRAAQMGFTGTVTKPIDSEELQNKIVRALLLDTSSRYFSQREGVLVVSLPAKFKPSTAHEVSRHLQTRLSEAVDAGISKLVLDLSKLPSADLSVIKLGVEVVELSTQLSLKHCVVGSPTVIGECGLYEDSKHWLLVASFEEALAALNGKTCVGAQANAF